MIIAQASDISRASSSLVQYGAIGACLVFAIIALVFMFKYIKSVHEDYSERIDTINKDRVEASNQAIEAWTVSNQKLEEQNKANNEMHDTLKRIAEKLNEVMGKLDRLLYRRGGDDD